MNNIDRAIVLDEAKAYSNRKGGYIKHKNEVCFPEAEFDFISGMNMDIPGKPFAEGDTVTVVYDGVQYVRNAEAFPYSNLVKGFYVGNLKIFGGADTGEPFALLSGISSQGEYVNFIAADTESYGVGDSIHRIGCSAKAKTIVPIDPKFLPGVCLPVLELSQETMAGVFASGNASCTAEEHAIIWGAYQALYPLIIKGNYNGIAFSGVSNIMLDNAYTPYFEANAGAMKVQVAFDDKTANVRSVQQ